MYNITKRQDDGFFPKKEVALKNLQEIIVAYQNL